MVSFFYTNKVIKGIVIMQSIVPHNTKLAASSCPSPTISEKFRTTEATGALASITKACFTA